MKMSKLTLALVATSALAACGGSGGGGGGSNPTPTATPPGGTASLCDESFVQCAGNTATLVGTVDKNLTLESGFDWQISGFVTVGNGNVEITSEAQASSIKANGVTLTIPAGTDIKATDDGVLLITRGSKLMANGTAANPITFSSADNNFDGFGEWGGVVVQGFAEQFGQGGTGVCHGGTQSFCNVAGEGGSGVAFYGGNDNADDSGVIRYVRIAEGGLVAGPNNEVNGLTLQGVGHGTTVEFVQVHNNLDDGVEWFGGTVNAKHLLLTGNDDDDIDFDEGYMGNIQYAIVQKSNNATPNGSNDPRGIEANSSDDEFVPETNAVLANVTLIGGNVNNAAGSEQPGMRLRGALTVAIHNSVVADFDEGCVRIDDADTDGNGTIAFSDVTLQNVFGDCTGGFYTHETADTELGTVGAQAMSFDTALAVSEAFANVGATSITALDNGSGFAFDQTDYAGAIEPGTSAANAWWAGWAIPGSLRGAGTANATPVCDESFVQCSGNTATLVGTVDKDIVLDSAFNWQLDGFVTVGNGNVEIQNETQATNIRTSGVTMTIPAGTDIKASDDGVLLITRGSKLMANGTAANPITFSSADPDFDGFGEWGGVVVQGFAEQFGQGGTGVCHGGTQSFCNVAGEGGSGVAFYGGNDNADDSGVIRYVRIAEGGLVAGPNNEVNGLTLQGVGHGTTVEFVQVHNNLDDGVEWFGGTVNAKFLLLTGNDDDDIDFDEGYKGNIQYAIVQKSNNATPNGSNDPRGIEANSSDDEFVPETNAVLANVTLIGGNVNNAAGSEQPGMRLRGALTVAIHNSVVADFNEGCVRIDDADTDGNGTIVRSDVTLQNVFGDCTGGFYTHETADSELGTVGAQAMSFDAAVAVVEAFANVGATSITALNNGSGFAFDQTDYVGAIEPGTAQANAWWAGWSIPNSVR